jgi:hypothetical protein
VETGDASDFRGDRAHTGADLDQGMTGDVKQFLQMHTRNTRPGGTVNVRRAHRNIGDGVRLNESTGTVSTYASRAKARHDRARTGAFGYYLGIR